MNEPKAVRPLTPIERLYEVAEDSDLPVLDDLLERAGLTWNCRKADDRICWTNKEDDAACGNCGRPRDTT